MNDENKNHDKSETDESTKNRRDVPLIALKDDYQISKSRVFVGENFYGENDKGYKLKSQDGRTTIIASMVYGLTSQELKNGDIPEEYINEKYRTATKKLLDMYMASLNTVELGKIDPSEITVDQFTQLVQCCFSREEFCNVLGVKPRSIKTRDLQMMAETIQSLFRLRLYCPETSIWEVTQVFSKCSYDTSGDYFYFTLNIADYYVRQVFFGSNGRFDNYFRYTISDISHVPNRSTYPYNLLMYILNKCPIRNTTNYFSFEDDWNNLRFSMELRNEEYSSLAVFRKVKLNKAAKVLRDEGLMDIVSYIPKRGSDRIHFEVHILPNCSRYYDPNGPKQKIDDKAAEDREKLFHDPVLRQIVLDTEDAITVLGKWDKVGKRNYLNKKDINAIKEQLAKLGEEKVRSALNDAINDSRTNIIGLFRSICITGSQKIGSVKNVDQIYAESVPVYEAIGTGVDCSEEKPSEETEDDSWAERLGNLW